MSLRKTLIATETAAFAIALISLYIVLFVLGNTLYIEDTARPAVTVAVAILAGAAALVGAIIHGVGLPPSDDSTEEKEKK